MQTHELLVDHIFWGDCIQVLTAIPEKSVNLIFADPPYNLQLEKELWRPDSTRVNGVDESWDQFVDFETYDRFTHSWLTACKRVLKDTGTIWVIGSYHNIFRVGRIMQDLGFWILNDIVWVKTNPMPNFHGVRFTNAHETLIWAQKIKGNKYTFNYQAMKSFNNGNGNENSRLQMRSDWRLPLCTGKERLRINGEKAHPTQKPEALLERVILSSSIPGDIVLDPFFGSGTTGAVAKRLGRHWIGIEADSRYLALAQKRIDAIIPRPVEASLFTSEEKRCIKRIPFRLLLEKDYIQHGQTLFFDDNEEKRAKVMPDGRLRYGEYSGSIHQVGRDILKAPCNGWMAWYYIDQATGKHQPIDFLRQMVRRDLLSGDLIYEDRNKAQ